MRVWILVTLTFGLIAPVWAAPPETFLLTGPQGGVHTDHAEFWWVGQPDPGHRILGYYYALDDQPPTFTTRTSVQFYGLTAQEHTFRVWAVDDTLTEDPDPAVQTWAILVTRVDELEPNDSAQNARSVVPDLKIVGRSFNAADEDWFRVSVQEKQLTISFVRTTDPGLAPQPIRSTTQIRLYRSPDVSQPVATFQVGPDTNQRGSLSVGVSAGEYLVQIAPSGEVLLTGEPYELTLAEIAMAPGAQWDQEPNSTAEAAQVLELAQTETRQVASVLGRADGAQDQDWFKFHVASPTPLRLRLQLHRLQAVGETRLRLYRSLPIVAERQVGAFTIAPANEQQAMMEVAVVLGDYFVQVEPSQEVSGAVYQLRIQLEPFPPETTLELEPNNVSPAINPTAPTALTLDRPIWGTNWDGNADVDWFRVTVPDDGFLAIWAERALGTGTTEITLYSPNLAERATWELNAANAQRASLVQPVSAGTYFLKLIPHDENPQASYQLLASYLREATHDAGRPLAAGVPLNLRVAWNPGQQVNASLIGNFLDPRVAQRLQALPLYDDGQHADGEANDGVYATRYVPQLGDDVAQARVQFELRDAQGRAFTFFVDPPVQVDTLFPQIEAVTHDGEGILQPGQTLTVTLVGEPGLSGFFDIEGFRTDLPLLEGDPGVYRGTYRVQPGDQITGARVIGRLIDGAGNESTREAEMRVNFASEGPALRQLIHTAKRPLRLGERFRVTLTAEPGLVVSFDLGTMRQGVPLYDDGQHGDGSADDGVYSAEYTVREGDDLKQGTLTVTARNAQGQQAQLVHPRPITLDGVRPQPIRGVQAEDRPEDQGGVIRVRWDPAPETDLAYYNVYLSDTPLATTQGQTPVQTGLTVPQTEIAGLQNGTDYTLAVTAVDAVGNESLLTADSRFGPVQARDNLPPPPIAGLTAFDTPDDAGHHVTLRWNPVVETGDFAYYALYLALEPIQSLDQAALVARETNPSMTVYEVSGLADELDAYFAVVAVDRAGNVSALGPGSVAGPVRSQNNLEGFDGGTLPFAVAPTGLVRSPDVAFAWARFVDGQAAASYRYQVDGGPEVPKNATRLVLRDLPAGSHTVRVTALNARGEPIRWGARRFTVAPFRLSRALPEPPSELPRLPLNVTLEAGAEAGGDAYQIVLERAGVLSLVARDAGLELWADGALLARSLADGALLAFVAPGAYRVVVNASGAYRLGTTFTPAEAALGLEREPNDTAEAVSAGLSLTPGEAVEVLGAAKGTDDPDWWLLQTPSSTDFRLRVTVLQPGAETPTRVGIYASPETLLAERTFQRDLPVVVSAVLPTGTSAVWVRVQGSSQAAAYHLRFDLESVEQPWEREPNDEARTATPLALDGSIWGDHWSEQDADWYRLDVSEAGILVLALHLESDATSGETLEGETLALADGAGEILAQAVAEAGATALFVDAPVGPGSYTIALHPTSAVAYHLDSSLVPEARHTAAGTLTLGDAVEVTVRWNPGARVQAALGSFQTAIPLSEDGDGTYHARIPIADGIQAEGVPLDVALTDAAGRTFRLTVAPPLSIDTLSSPITSVRHDATGPLALGDVLRVAVQAIPGALVSFDVGSVRRGIPLYDDGQHEDGAANDGVYGGQFVVEEGDQASEVPVTVHLRKPNGREVSQDAEVRVTLDGVLPEAPSAVEATDVPEDEGGWLEVQWQASGSSDVAGYAVYVSAAPIAAVEGLLPALTGVQETSVRVPVPQNGMDVFVAVVAVDRAGNRSRLTPDSVAGPVQARDNLPPEPVSGVRAMDRPHDAGGFITLTWERPSTAPDFAAYHVYRDDQPITAPQPTLRAMVIPARALISVDVPVPLDGADTYFAVTAVDTAGNESPLAEDSVAGPVQAVADRQPPAPATVRLLDAPPGLSRHADVGFTWSRFSEGTALAPLSAYEYRLDDQPPQTTRATQVFVPDLAPGEHRFAIRAEGEDAWLTYPFTVSTTVLLEAEPNETPEQANFLWPGRTWQGRLEGDPDLYRLEMSELSRIQVLYRQDRGVTQVRLYQDAASPILMWRVRDRLAARFVLPAGRYWLALQAEEGTPRYQFSVEWQAPDGTWEVEPNDGASVAMPLAMDVERRGGLQRPGDADWFVIEVAASASRIAWQVLEETDTSPLRVRWLSETLSLIAQTTTESSAFAPLPLRPGRYFLVIDAPDAGEEELPGYSVRLHREPLAGEEIEPNDAPLQAMSLPLETTLAGAHLSGDQDRDWFQLDLPQSGVLLLHFERQTPGTGERVSLTDARQTRIQERVLTPDDPPETQFALPLAQGRYFLQVQPEGGAEELARYRLVAFALQGVQHDARRVLGVGDVLTVELRWTPGRTPAFSLGNLASRIPLFDDGTHGDTAAGDGVYVGQYAVQPGDQLVDGAVRIHLTDDAGQEVVFEPSEELSSLLPPVQIDTLPPAILAANHDAREPLGAGAEVRFRVQTEPGATVRVQIEGIPGEVPLADDGGHDDDAAEDGVYGGVYRVSPQDDVADATVWVEATDSAGNTTRQKLTRPLTFDGVPPAITSVTVEAPPLLTEGDTLTVTVMAEAGLEGSFSIGALRTDLPLTPQPAQEGASSSYVGRYTARPGDQAFDAPVVVRLRDAAGNVSEAQAAQLVQIDTLPPQIERVELGVLGETPDAILPLPPALSEGTTLIVTVVGEPGATGTFDLGEVHPGLPLFDDGAHGDGAAGDGTYRGRYVVQPGDAWEALRVTVHLQKTNGKRTDRVAAPTLRVDTVPPAAVTGVSATDRPDDEGFWVVLRWQPVDEADFSHYRIYRSTSPIGVLTGLAPIQRVDAQGIGQVELEVPQNQVYYYFAVAAVDQAGNVSPLQSGEGGSVSNAVQALDNLPPPPVRGVQAVDVPGDTGGRISVAWAEPSGAEDFAQYNVYLDVQPIQDVQGLRPVLSVPDRRLIQADVSVGANGVDYYVAVTAEDRAGNESPLTVDSVAGPVQALDNTGAVGPTLVQLFSGPMGQVRQSQVSFRWSRWSPEGAFFDGYFYQLDNGGFQFTRANQVSFYGLRDGVHQFLLKPTPDAVPLVRTFSVLATTVEEAEPNDDPTDANTLPPGIQLQGMNPSDGDMDWFRLVRPSLETPRVHLNVQLSRPAGVGQTIVTLFDATLPQESARLGEFRIEGASRQRGGITLGVGFNDILIRVRSEGENPSAAYLLSATFEHPQPGDVWEVEPNDVVDAATPIPPEAQEVSGIANRPDDVDWFRTQPLSSAQGRQFLTLEFARPLSVGTTRVQIYAGLPILPERQVGDFQLDPSVSQRWRWATPLGSGDYVIRVEHGSEVQTTPYAIRATLTPIPADQTWETEPNGTPSAASTLELGQVTWGTSWHPNDDQDWFRLRVPESGILSVGLERPGGAGITQARLLNAGQAEIATLTISPETGQAGSLSVPITAGDYYLVLDPENEDTTLPYQVMALVVRAFDHDAADVLGLNETLTVRLNVGGASLAEAPTWAIWEGELPIVTDLPLRDDGLEGDLAAGDGIFTGTFTVPPETDVAAGRVIAQLHAHPPLTVEPVGDRPVILDSVPPRILDFRHDAVEPLTSGRELVMRLVSEPGGEGFYELSAGDFRIFGELFDDGQHNDEGPNDGVYGGSYLVQPGDNQEAIQVTGILRDAAGNEARKTALRPVTFDTQPPRIQEITHDAQGVLREGARLRVQLRGEAGGKAEFDLTGYKERIPLYDDGTHGDLTANDGVYTTVYFVQEGEQAQNVPVTGRLIDRAGNVAELVADVLVSIDTQPPAIQSITHNAQRPLIRGDVLVVRLQGEPGGKARFDIGEAILGLPLADDGAGEDEQANDGVYTGTYVVQLGDNVRNAVITGYLVDESGNEAVSHAAIPVTLDAVAPDPVRDVVAEDLEGDEGHVLLVRWSPVASSEDFSHYNIYAERSPIRSTRVLIPVMTSLVLPEVTTAEISVPSNNVDYYIAVTAVDTANNESELADSSVTGPVQARDNIPPEPVIVVSAQDRPEDNGQTLLVSWTQTNADEDFDRYEVYVDTQPLESVEGLQPAASVRDRNQVEVEVPVPEDGVDYYVAVVARDVNENRSPLDAEGRSVAGPVQSKDELPPSPVEGVIAVDTPSDAGGSIRVAWQPIVGEGVREYRVYLSERPFAGASPEPETLAMVVSGEDADLVELTWEASVGVYVAVTAVDLGENESILADTSTAGPVYPVDNRVAPRQTTRIAAGFDPLTWVRLEAGAVDKEATLDLFATFDADTEERILEADHFLEQAHIDPTYHEALAETLREVVLRGGTLIGKATLQIAYPDLGAEEVERDLRIFQLDTTGEVAFWRLLPGEQRVDTRANTVSAPITRMGVFRISRLQLPETLDDVVVFPNPFIPSESVSKRVTFLNLTAQATIEIYTLDGQRVITLDVPYASGRATWDGRNEAGEEVASGLYYYVVYNDADKKVGRILVVR